MERSQAERKRQAGVEHDQFFTRPQLASEWAAWVKSQPFYHKVNRVIDPAAGARALSRHFPSAEEYDLHPQANTIARQDFLLSNHRYEPGTLVIMNPPFGTGSDLAIAFFNKAASFADYIAGIFPRSFRRGSLQARLADDWGLVDEWVLPSYSFFLPSEGREIPYDVPAVAQIWARGVEERAAPPPTKTVSDHFSFTVPAKADFAFRRKGRRAGEVVGGDDAAVQNPNSFYFIAGDDRVRQAFERIDWSGYGQDAIGARYITKAEIVAAVEAVL
jgi:hypothetical protein